MRLEPGCPKCPAAVALDGSGVVCPTHGATTPLWRSVEPGYDAFADHLVRSRSLPTWLPWPLPPGWQVTDFGCVGREGEPPRATFATCSGPTDADGVVELTVLTEEPGVGLGSRCARVAYTDPGQVAGAEPAALRVRVDAAAVPLWPVSTSDTEGLLDRSVLAGEAQGRWLWLVLRPASAALSLGELPAFHDVSALGPELVVMPFGATPRAW